MGLTPALPELPGRFSGCYWPFSLAGWGSSVCWSAAAAPGLCQLTRLWASPQPCLSLVRGARTLPHLAILTRPRRQPHDKKSVGVCPCWGEQLRRAASRDPVHPHIVFPLLKSTLRSAPAAVESRIRRAAPSVAQAPSMTPLRQQAAQTGTKHHSSGRTRMAGVFPRDAHPTSALPVRLLPGSARRAQIKQAADHGNAPTRPRGQGRRHG